MKGRLNLHQLKTGIVYDDIFLKHDYPGHPENANRLKSIITGLTQQNLLGKTITIESRLAGMEEIAICHSKEYIRYVKEFCGKGGGYLDPDTYSNHYSYEAAIKAVGGSIDLATSVIKGELKNGFALLRPPGHHALANKSMGFCLFGNIAIAAKIALTQPGINKVAIVDFDVHHGNGTQALIGDDPNILFISSHQYPFYPGTGSINEIGNGEAEGTVINIPFPAGVGDNGFRKAYETIVIPSIEKFKPDLILISAGYDAHWDDPLANLSLSLRGFNWISKRLIETANKICSSKIVFFLEGGYNLEVLKFGVTNSTKTLMGIEDFQDPIGPSSIQEPNVERLIKELQSIHNL
jgi:acetoin utilization deacetylase AcuC-like enzyme